MERYAIASIYYSNLYIGRCDLKNASSIISNAANVTQGKRSPQVEEQLESCLAEIDLMTGNYDDCLSHLNLAIDLAIKMGNHLEIMWFHLYRAVVFFDIGKNELSYQAAIEALEQSKFIDAEYSGVGAKCFLALIEMNEGCAEEAQHLCDEVIIMTDAMPLELETPTLGLAWIVNGLFYLRCREANDDLNAIFDRGFDLMKNKRMPIFEGICREWLATALIAANRNDEAIENLDLAEWIFINLNNQLHLQRTLDIRKTISEKK